MLLKATLTVLAVFSMVGVAHAADNIEGPQYEVLASENGVELREYAPYLVAEVTVEAPSRSAASSLGFRPLAGYIFGGNTSRDEIAMTAPVTTQSSGTEIAMTAPVTTADTGAGLYTVHFTMPRKWTMDTLPVPNDPRVTLKEVPAEKRLAYRFVGVKAQDSIDRADAAILAYATRNDVAVSVTSMIAGYDGPRTPSGKRRWEVMRVVE